MVSPAQSDPSKPHQMRTPNSKPISFITDSFLFVGGAMSALLLVWGFVSFVNPNNQNPNFTSSPSSTFTRQTPTTVQGLLNCAGGAQVNDMGPNFYDDPNLSYSIEKPMKGWDEKRREWLKQHPSFASGAQDRIVMVSGSQPSACKHPIGDNLLLRFFKNKVDYCRLHGHDFFYNNALLHPKMGSYWAKIPVVRSTMIAHPEAEWIWWVDSDAAFTDMEFKLPLEKYKDHNFILHGWADLVFEAKSWVSLNAGVFLIRNCQWSMDFMESWAKMGPQTPDYAAWGKTQRSIFKDKLFPEADDQTGLAYLLVEEKDKWANKVYLESDFYFEGYWEEIVGAYNNITKKYMDIERKVPKLRRRHAEKVSESYGALREEYLKEAGFGKGSWRRPFITHFTGCQPCSGNHNERYTAESCLNGMEIALNFADNQVLRNYGYVRPDLLNASTILQVPFNYPAEKLQR